MAKKKPSKPAKPPKKEASKQKKPASKAKPAARKPEKHAAKPEKPVAKKPVHNSDSKHPLSKPDNNNSSTVSLSKLGKAKIRSKTEQQPLRKIEKIIDIGTLEKKLADIMSLNHAEFTIEEKLKALYVLQQIDSNIDKIRTVRGELPMEVTDLEDEVAGLETRITHINNEITELQEMISKKKQSGKDSKDQIKKYEGQQGKVKNNREYESLTKEIEFQNLEIQLAEKRQKEHAVEIKNKEMLLEAAQANLDEKKNVLKTKKTELDSIIAETQKEEEQLEKISQKARAIADERLLTAYQRVRENARNGLAVVAVQRDACGGCFNKIPPQRQLDIRQHKKVIVCEHCGRILVDASIEAEEGVTQ